jgi:hypothetical protein
MRASGLAFALCVIALGVSACGDAPRPPAPVQGQRQAPALASHRLRFGIEIETGWLTGYTQEACIDAMYMRFFGASESPHVKAPLEGRPWFVEAFPAGGAFEALRGAGWISMCDLSLTWQQGDELRVGEELGSPVMTHDRRDEAALVARAAAEAGGTSMASTGIHIHLGVEPWSMDTIYHLIARVSRHEDALYRVLKINTERRVKYARPLSTAWLRALSRDLPADRDALLYSFLRDRTPHTHGLDVAPIVRLGTVEFRYFNGSLDPEVVTLYIDTVYALAELAERAGSFDPVDAMRLAYPMPESFEAFLAAIETVDPELRRRLEAFDARDAGTLGPSFAPVTPAVRSSMARCRTRGAVSATPVVAIEQARPTMNARRYRST